MGILHTSGHAACINDAEFNYYQLKFTNTSVQINIQYYSFQLLSKSIISNTKWCSHMPYPRLLSRSCVLGEYKAPFDCLRAGRSGDRIPVGAWFSAPVQTEPEAHPASCTMGTGSFPGVRCGRGVILTPHPLLVPRSKIEYSYISSLPEGLRDLWKGWSLPTKRHSVCTGRLNNSDRSGLRLSSDQTHYNSH